MTEAGWTRNAPTKEGWYWWQRTENDNPVVVWVNAFHPDKQLRAEMISGRRELLTHFTGLFKGPITPDSYQQGRVAGLVRGAQLVRWHKSCAFEADPALALERAAKDIESVASQIIQPQQAQEGVAL